jgi:hypothetical protein
MKTTKKQDIEKAQRKIKNHLQRLGHTEIHLSEKIVKIWWKHLNMAVFDDKLPYPISINVQRLAGAHAHCIADYFKNNVTIGIHNTFTSREKFLTALVHEMVHQWEFCVHGTMTHGPKFYSWKKKILLRVNLPLGQAV